MDLHHSTDSVWLNRTTSSDLVQIRWNNPTGVFLQNVLSDFSTWVLHSCLFLSTTWRQTYLSTRQSKVCLWMCGACCWCDAQNNWGELKETAGGQRETDRQVFYSAPPSEAPGRRTACSVNDHCWGKPVWLRRGKRLLHFVFRLSDSLQKFDLVWTLFTHPVAFRHFKRKYLHFISLILLFSVMVLDFLSPKEFPFYKFSLDFAITSFL